MKLCGIILQLNSGLNLTFMNIYSQLNNHFISNMVLKIDKCGSDMYFHYVCELLLIFMWIRKKASAVPWHVLCRCDCWAIILFRLYQMNRIKWQICHVTCFIENDFYISPSNYRLASNIYVDVKSTSMSLTIFDNVHAFADDMVNYSMNEKSEGDKLKFRGK